MVFEIERGLKIPIPGGLRKNPSGARNKSEEAEPSQPAKELDYFIHGLLMEGGSGGGQRSLNDATVSPSRPVLQPASFPAPWRRVFMKPTGF
jgi:hypothetical protein